MRQLLAFAILLSASISFSVSAHACATSAPIEVEDVKYADVVVMGRITNYRPVLDTGNARFDVLVDEVLAGEAPETLAVIWNSATFGEPVSMPTGQFLIALMSYGSEALPMEAQGAPKESKPATNMFVVKSAPCSQYFLFPSKSEEAIAIRRVLNR